MGLSLEPADAGPHRKDGLDDPPKDIHSAKRIATNGFRASRIADTARWRIDARP